MQKIKFFVRLYLLMLSGVPLASSQSGFLDSTYVWNEQFSGGFPYVRYSERYTFSALPQEINGLSYYELLISFNPQGSDWQRTFNYYRNDSTGKVFTLVSGESETLVYDYSLIINDTFKTNINYTPLVVEFIDSIQLNDGSLRKRMTMRCTEDNRIYFWFEGIGGSNGLRNFYTTECAIDGFSNETLCISRNDTLLYKGSDLCWYPSVAVIEPFKDPLLLYPNPTRGISQITGFTDTIRVSIWDSTGAFIRNLRSKDIDLLDDPPGLYIIRIESRSNQSVIFRSLIKI